MFKVRVAKACTAGETVLLLPLEDERLQSLDILIAPSISKVDGSGYTTVRGVNPHNRPVTVPLLTQVARFIVDPRISGAGLEFTTDEIMERIHLPEGMSRDELQYVRHMI